MFRLDSKLMSALSTFTDYIILVIFCVVFSIPIFTIGASVSAMYYVSMKMARGKDVYIFRDFIKGFKDNFKKSTIAWVILLVLDVIVAYTWIWLYYEPSLALGKTFTIIFLILSVYLVLLQLMIFPFMARFDNTVYNTFKLTMGFTLIKIIPMALVLFLNLLPILLSYKYIVYSIGIMPVGEALALYLNGYIFANMFKKIEPEQVEEPVEEEDNSERIFSDKLLDDRA